MALTMSTSSMCMGLSRFQAQRSRATKCTASTQPLRTVVARPADDTFKARGQWGSRRDLYTINTRNSTRAHDAVRAINLTVSAIAAEEEGKPKLGFIGMGIMGVPMTLNLLKAGYEVTVWNRSADKCKPAVEAGAKMAQTASEVVEASDITFAMLSDPEAALEVATMENGVAAGMSAGKGYVDVSTVDPATAALIAAAVNAKGGRFLEAPVSGSKKPAEDGLLIFLTAGDEGLFAAAEPMLEVMGKARFFLGAVGKGAEMKLVVNMVMGSMLVGFSEGLQLGKKAGLDQNQILEVISLGAIASQLFAVKGPGMIQGTAFPPAFPLKHQQKDLRLAVALGDELAQDLPVAKAANDIFKKAVGKNLGDNDFSAVIKALQED
eukprot:CAMPEP_0198199560 /NCGR_PEP_ID=MMETSP1445-20131203/2827_1 /TAXON_ID=36898 /ORGANISM="Pyramimonas sp., Strain CCMP2087" /LENGTH=378 /DNA_ID=CAMNT_0043869437 /DNA_START=64 /DNA_END=1200 /DNA_ORIENTATION=+